MLCSSCGENKSELDFPRVGRKCKKCINKSNITRYHERYRAERMAKRRAEAMEDKSPKPSTVSEVDRAYAAGIVDGEGCIRINIRKAPLKKGVGQLTLIITVVNTNEDVVRWLKDRWPQSAVARKEADHGNNRRAHFTWNVVANRALFFLDDIYPFLIIKRKQAKLARRYQRYVQRNGSHRAEKLLQLQMRIALLMRTYNQRGTKEPAPFLALRPEWQNRQ